MTYDHSTTLRYSEDLQQAFDDVLESMKYDEDLPELSQSELMREIFWTWLDDGGKFADLIEPETLILAERERHNKKGAKLVNLRSGFETRVKDMFKRRFENGYQPDQLLEFAANCREEARILWKDRAIELEAERDPEVGDVEERIEELRARRRECIDYVDQVVDAAIEAVETSDRDPLDPEQIFASYEGVEDGAAREQLEESQTGLEAEARTMIRRIDARRSVDVDAISTVLAKQHGVGRQAVVEVVRDVTAEVRGGPGADGGPEPEPDDDQDRSDRVTGADLGVGADDVGANGTVESEAYGALPDGDDDPEPDEEAVEAAIERVQDGKALGIIPEMLRLQEGVDEEIAVVSTQEAIRRLNTDDEAQEAIADD